MGITGEFVYDPASNLLDENAPAGQRLKHNRLTQFNGIEYQYDAHGRTQEKQDSTHQWRYDYDTEHRLSKVTCKKRHHAEYQSLWHEVHFTYDPLGRRTNKTTHYFKGSERLRTEQTDFVWEGTRLLGEVNKLRSHVYVYDDQQSYTLHP